MSSRLEFDAVKKNLAHLLGQLDRSELVLPEFQRSFVWKPGQIVELLGSICRSYPSGSLLFLRYRKDVLAVRPVESADRSSGQPVSIILDGQQRLTALYHALYGKGEFRYFLDLKELEQDDLDEGVQVYGLSEVKRRKLDDETTQYESKVLPVASIVDGLEKWKWGFFTYRRDKESVDYPDSGKWFQSIQEKYIDPVLKYQFPVVELPENTDFEIVSEIFEILNRTGTKLTLFDLMTAKLWPSKIRLRELWKAAKEQGKLQTQFLDDPTQVLQTISLIRAGNCQKKDVLKLDASGFSEDWLRAVNGIRKAIGLLKGECGVLTPRWLPYSTMLPPMAAAISLIEELPPKDKGEAQQKLIRWFWCAALGEKYERSTATQAGTDYTQLERWFDGGPEMSTVKGFTFRQNALYEASKQTGAIYRAVICLAISNGARDFAKGSKISTLDLLDEEIDDHHVYPAAYLRSRRVAKQVADCVLNRALIDASTNRGVISSKAPAKYLSELARTFDDETFMDILRSQLLVRDKNSSIFNDSFNDFLDERSRIICDQIRKVTGGNIAESIALSYIAPMPDTLGELPSWTTVPTGTVYSVPSASSIQTNADLIEGAIRSEGGTATLDDIYKSVRKQRPKASRHVIRATLYLNLIGGRGHSNRFARKGRGSYGMADEPPRQTKPLPTGAVPGIIVSHGEKGLDQVLAVASLMKKGLTWNKACRAVASEGGTKHNTVMAATTRRLHLDGKADFETHLRNGTLSALLISRFPNAMEKIESVLSTHQTF